MSIHWPLKFITIMIYQLFIFIFKIYLQEFWKYLNLQNHHYLEKTKLSKLFFSITNFIRITHHESIFELFLDICFSFTFCLLLPFFRLPFCIFYVFRNHRGLILFIILLFCDDNIQSWISNNFLQISILESHLFTHGKMTITT